jgi:leucyl-tRNA synthetase
MNVERYNARTAEIHWQQAWDAQKAFAARSDDSRPGFGLNIAGCPTVGNDSRIRLAEVRCWTMADVVARYKRASGFNVLPPAGDAAEVMKAELKQLKPLLGLSLDWNRAATARDACAGGEFLGPRALISAASFTRKVRAGGTPAVPGELSDVDSADLIDSYGADAVRWFVLSDSPPDRDPVWSENGCLGAWRFVHRVWRLINDAKKFSAGGKAARPAADADAALDLRKTAHRALPQVSGNIERLRFNVCVARIHAFARTLETAVANASGPAGPDLKFAAREAAEILVQLFHPMMPHLAEECWAALGHDTLLATRNWPSPEAGLLMEDTVTLSVHFNGRKRADVTVARDARNGDIEASVLALDAIRQGLDGKAPRKVIIVPQRIINVVA